MEGEVRKSGKRVGASVLRGMREDASLREGLRAHDARG